MAHYVVIVTHDGGPIDEGVEGMVWETYLKKDGGPTLAEATAYAQQLAPKYGPCRIARLEILPMTFERGKRHG